MTKLGLWAVWWLSFPVPRLWEVLPFLLCSFMLLVSLVFVWPVPEMWAGGSCLYVLSGGLCFGLMPLSYVFRGGTVHFSFVLVAFGFLYCSWLFCWALAFW